MVATPAPARSALLSLEWAVEAETFILNRKLCVRKRHAHILLLTLASQTLLG